MSRPSSAAVSGVLQVEPALRSAPAAAADGRPLRVLFVISGLTFGGAERQVVLLARELVRMGHRALIYTLTPDVPRRGELDGTGVELVVDRKGRRLDPAVLRRLRARVVDWRADVVHSFLYDADIYSRIAGWGLGVPVLNSARNDNHPVRALHRLGLALTRPGMHGLVANSHAGAGFVQRIGKAAAHQVHVVWNGIDLDEVDARLAASGRPAHALWPQAGVRRVAVVGAIKPQKDHELALRVAQALNRRDPAWRFLFVGDSLEGGDAHKARVLAACQALGAQRYVRFTGVRGDALELMADCDALLVTSLFEGFPNVVLEAMACGTPVATTDYSDVRRIVPFGWQVAADRSAGELASIVERCVAEREAVVRAQRAWVEAHATARRSTEALMAVYRRYVRPRAEDLAAAR